MELRDDDRTSWELIQEAAGGERSAREEFARRYSGVVRSFLGSREGGGLGRDELEDATQEVFFECFKHEGLLERARQGAGRGFRAFLSVACRNVALRFTTRRARRRDQPGASTLHADQLPLDDETLGRAFDRAWAQELLRRAADYQEEEARTRGPECVRRVELLRLRLHEGLPIRAIAENWGLAPEFLHHEYAQARREFERSLRAVIALENPGDPEAVGRELGELLTLYRD
jgi:hypothetical protein